MKAASLLLMICMTCGLQPALAAEAPVAEDVTAAATTDPAAEPAPDAAAMPADSAEATEDPTPGTMAADDTFIPTVEISEDLSVSFPADI